MKTALLLDDDDLCRDLMTEILSQRQYKVIAFRSPAELFAQRGTCGCSEGRLCADLIITDNKMPIISGLNFLQQIAAAGCRLPGQRKALITSQCTMEDFALAHDLGCSVFFKPDYFDAINDWLNQLSREHTHI